MRFLGRSEVVPVVENTQAQYEITILGNSQKDGHTEYIFKIKDHSNADEWVLEKRYREVRELHEHLKLKWDFFGRIYIMH